MNKFLGYTCSICGTEYSCTQELYTCPKDGGNLDIVLDIASIIRKYEFSDITSREENYLWRYLPLLPVVDPGFEGTPFRMTGGTPVYNPTQLRIELGLKNLWIKDEGKNPTASFKDRASAVVIARAREIGSEIVVTASTGNAGAALAGLAASIGQKAIIFAPKTAPPAKIAQLLVYRAEVILVDGNYDSAFDLSIEAVKEFGWYCRNTGFNPFTIEGKKTAAFEIWEEIIIKKSMDFKPLSIFVSVGDGNIISGIHKGFKDLISLGWIEHMPRIFGIQSEGSAAIANAFSNKSENIIPVNANTIADSISVDLPRDGVRAVRAATQTNGAFLTVTDQQILEAIAGLGKAGIFSEPAAATAYAGLVKAIESGIINQNDPVLVVNTGSGLKDIRAAMMAVKAAPIIEPTMADLKRYLQKN
ncbi:MAG: threonine synthase [Anaerolineaceae bacterium]|nr:threonine synthase [Anaerolineaceae bacterium]